MIARISIKGLGPHEDTDIELSAPMGTNTIVGRSEAGKSTLIDAVAFCLWGMDRRGGRLDLGAMRDGCDEMKVELTVGRSGTKMVRTLRRKKDGGRGDTTRVIVNSMGTKEHTTEKAWLGALRDIGARPKALRQVLVPHAWVALVDGEGGGRPFAHFLGDILPKADKAEVVRSLMGDAWRDGDPVNVTDALDMRKRANRDKAEQSGDVKRLDQLISVAEAQETQSGPDIGGARGVIDLAKEWDVYEAVAEVHVEHEEWATKQTDLAEEWDEKAAELGERPEADQGAEEAEAAAKQLLVDLRTRGAELQSLRGDAERAQLAADHALDALKTAPAVDALLESTAQRLAVELAAAIDACHSVNDTCPTCERPGWAGAIAAVDAARQTVADAHASAVTAVDQSRVFHAASAEEEEEVQTERLATATEKITRLEDDMQQLDVDLGKAEHRRTRAMRGQAPALAWDEARRLLGERPEVPEPSDPPTGPTVRRPDAREVESARRSVEEHDRSQGAQTQRSEDLEQLRHQLELSQEALEELMRECDRLETLVDAVRKAPSVAAARQLGVLGDMGPVEIVLPEDGSAEVLVDGRPWHFASTGRLVVADAHLRAGLRRALKASWLPLFVDCVQDVAGIEIPDVSPAILLRTTDEEGLAVSS